MPKCPQRLKERSSRPERSWLSHIHLYVFAGQVPHIPVLFVRDGFPDSSSRLAMAFLLASVMRMSVRIDVPSTNQAEHLGAGVAGARLEAALFVIRG